MSALSNGGNYDVCDCSSCRNEVHPTKIYYDDIKNKIYLWKWDSRKRDVVITPTIKQKDSDGFRLSKYIGQFTEGE